MRHRTDQDGDSSPVARRDRGQGLIIDLPSPLCSRIILEAAIPSIIDVMLGCVAEAIPATGTVRRLCAEEVRGLVVEDPLPLGGRQPVQGVVRQPIMRPIVWR